MPQIGHPADSFHHNVSDHRDSSEPQQVFVAFFDVLGFQSRLRDSGLARVLQTYRELVGAKIESAIVPVLSSRGVNYRKVGSTIFSDSIIFWCNDDYDSVQSLLSASAHLIAAAVDLAWPLRGGLAYGSCVLDRETKTFIGQPIIDAFKIEGSQRWIGAALHKSVLAHPLFGAAIATNDDVIKYEIPVKENQETLSHAVHWCPYSYRAKSAIEEMKSYAAERKIQNYYDETKRYVLNTCKEYHSAAN